MRNSSKNHRIEDRLGGRGHFASLLPARLMFDVAGGRTHCYGWDGEVRDILVEIEEYVAFSSPSRIC